MEQESGKVLWKEIIEQGVVWYVNEEVGNIQKLANGQFVALVPKVVRLGPFNSLDEAKQAVEDKQGLNQIIETYNINLTQLSNALRKK